MKFVRSVWYAAGWSSEIKPGELFHRRLLDEPVVFFRKPDGEVAALQDRCPHRFAPLHRGSLEGDRIQCGYHGLVFDSSGQCVRNPRGKVPDRARVRSFPVREQDGIVWSWFGEPSQAKSDLVPDYVFLGQAKPSSRIEGYIPTGGYYELCNDNIMDLSHIDFLHPTSLGSGSIGGVTPQVTQEGKTVHIRWSNSGERAAPIYDPFLPSPGMTVEQVIEVTWQPAANMLLTNTMTPAGYGSDRALISKNVHLITPETADRSHYFYAGTRNFAADDWSVNEARAAAIRSAFENEDKPMIEAVQKSMGPQGDLLNVRPVLLQGDGGAMLARRILHLLRERESTSAPQVQEQASEISGPT